MLTDLYLDTDEHINPSTILSVLSSLTNGTNKCLCFHCNNDQKSIKFKHLAKKDNKDFLQDRVFLFTPLY